MSLFTHREKLAAPRPTLWGADPRTARRDSPASGSGRG